MSDTSFAKAYKGQEAGIIIEETGLRALTAEQVSTYAERGYFNHGVLSNTESGSVKRENDHRGQDITYCVTLKRPDNFCSSDHERDSWKREVDRVLAKHRVSPIASHLYDDGIVEFTTDESLRTIINDLRNKPFNECGHQPVRFYGSNCTWEEVRDKMSDSIAEEGEEVRLVYKIKASEFPRLEAAMKEIQSLGKDKNAARKK